MTAEERGSELFNIKMSEVPEMAKAYLKDLSSRVGYCGEVAITAFTTYAQLSEGLECTDTLYIPSEDEIKIYNKLKEKENKK